MNELRTIKDQRLIECLELIQEMLDTLAQEGSINKSTSKYLHNSIEQFKDESNLIKDVMK